MGIPVFKVMLRVPIDGSDINTEKKAEKQAIKGNYCSCPVPEFDVSIFKLAFHSISAKSLLQSEILQTIRSVLCVNH